MKRYGLMIAPGLLSATVVLAGFTVAVAQPTLKDVLKSSSAEVEPLRPGTDPDVEAKDEFPSAEVDNPSAAFQKFRAAVDAGDFISAGRFLDLPAARMHGAPTLARQLGVVLDRSLWVDPGDLSSDAAGDTQDGLPAQQDRVGTIESNHGDVDVILERANRAGEARWLFSRATVARIPALYGELGSTVLTNLLPPFFFEIQFVDLQLWQWLAVLLLAVAAYGSALLGVGLLIRIVGPLMRRTRVGAAQTLLSRAAGPLRLALAVIVFSAGVVPIGLPIVARAVVAAFAKALLIIAFTWFVLRLLDVVAEWVAGILIERGQTSASALLPPGRKVAKVLVVGLAAVAILDNLGFNVTALVAGLGIGGIAVALAAQKSVENLFGGITLYGDQPVRVGDFCRFGDKIGTIEEIGLRSTRVRSLERSVITVPNGEFANMPLENLTERDKMWYHPTLGLRYETTPDQMRFILHAIQDMLRNHPRVDPDPARVRFVAFNAYSLDLEVFAYVKERDFGRYLEVAEALNLRIMDIVAEAGSSFAFPSQTTYHEPGTGVDVERQRAAEEAGRKWREPQTKH